MVDEMASMRANKMWTLCQLPPRRKCIGTKWVYKLKRDGNGKFTGFKARLVVKGYLQVFGIDFDNTYAPVVRIDTVGHLFALAACYGWHILHADAKIAYLNCYSDVEIYIFQPKGFVASDHPDMVLRLNKSPYGLKQAPRIW